MYAGEHARTHPERPAFIMAASGEVITFGEYEGRANRLAGLFRSGGLRRLDHVAVFMENNPRIFEFEGAAERTGLYYTCVNSYLSAEEVAYIVNDCQARVVLTSWAQRNVALQLPALCPRVERWLMVDAEGPEGGYERYEEAVAGFAPEPVGD